MYQTDGRLCWYVADKYCSELRQARAYRARALSSLAPPHQVVLEGLVHLANFLISQTDIIENPDEEDKKRSLAFNKIPHEIVKDPSGLARELLWRVKRELGHEVDQAAVAEALQPQTTAKQSLPQTKSKSRKDLRKSAISRTVNFDSM
jgi:F-box/leucine-rich repeat protein 10/11